MNIFSFNLSPVTKTLLMVCLLVVGMGMWSEVMANPDAATIEAGIKDVNVTVFQWAIRIMSLVLFLFAMWMLIEGYINHQLQQKWISIIGIGIFLIFLNLFPLLYEALTGTTATGTAIQGATPQ